MQKRILTGDRTTGRLHLGHLVGSLNNRVRLQRDYDTFILLADVQALTTHFTQPDRIREAIYQVAIDNLSVGLDPERITLVQQSQIGAIAELTVLYAMLVPVNVLRHNPTIKTEAAQYGYDEMTYGFLGYPVSQAADITFCQADLVPVGEDQLLHLEQTHRIVRRFNALYGDTLKQPEGLLGSVPRLAGLDGGAKMGKSLGNAIYLADPPDRVRAKVLSAVTDTTRIHARDPGHPEVCVVNQYHRAFNAAEYPDICAGCAGATLGCVACKKRLADRLEATLAPIRERRAHYEAHRDQVTELIQAGNDRANAIGRQTLAQVKEAMRLAL
ncbi:MAG: tryptophan--tRNA ligase [Christensenellales bacterium]|jgi:tryptophanyl-tRNA synthetase